MEKRTLLAVVLTAAVWIAWFYIFNPADDTKQSQPPAKIAEQTSNSNPEQVKASDAPSRTQEVLVKALTAASGVKESVVSLQSSQFEMEISTLGASVKKMRLKDRDIKATAGENPFAAKGSLDFAVHFSKGEFLGTGSLDSINWRHFQRNDGAQEYTASVSLNGGTINVTKRYTVPEKGDAFNVYYSFKNTGRTEVFFPDSSIIFSPTDLTGPELDYSNNYNMPAGIFSIAGDFTLEHKGSGFFSKAGDLKSEDGSTDWVGVTSRYLLAIMKPVNFTGTGIVFDNRTNKGFRTGMKVALNSLKPGEEAVREFRVYVGEKEKSRLEAVDPGLKDAADVSKWIEPIRYFVMWCLLNINKLFGNMGWALVVFSILTKIVFMPLTKKSTDSMKKMQKLTPKINELKAKYKDKPDVMQKKMMELYKENKVNPMGGCLPILLQMPFFFALYSALINSMDLWNAPFILWINDLSMPDTVATLSGFNVNILPIVMTITTFIQQKISMVDTGQGGQQKFMMMAMPLVFIFIFWSMPSGLVLYWTLQNVFQIAHQLIVNKFGKSNS